nr:MAG TPA: hypothetical protein [Caudoviricetes sp.]DAZ13327.1 MAG TPA: hypothetical protein [Caudoviricetes sp.]
MRFSQVYGLKYWGLSALPAVVCSLELIILYIYLHQ